MAEKVSFDLTPKEAQRMYSLGRFFRKVNFHPNGHWLWRGGLTSDGYGRWQLTDSRRKVLTHRFIYEELVGPIPDGLEIDHLCEIHNCCNPDHLEPVTSQENKRRSIERRRTYARASYVM